MDPKRLSSRQRVAGFWLLALATLLVGSWLETIDRELETAGEGGIVALELAACSHDAEGILCAWEERQIDAGEVTALDRARRSLWIDFLFMVLYPAAIAAGCIWSVGVFRERGVAGDRLLRGLAFAQAGALGLDLVENVALLRMIGRFAAERPLGDALPFLAAWCAATKFAIVSVGLLGVAAGLVVRALGPLSPDGPPDGSPDGRSDESGDPGDAGA